MGGRFILSFVATAELESQPEGVWGYVKGIGAIQLCWGQIVLILGTYEATFQMETQ